MKQLIRDIIGFLRNINKIDYLLYFAILVLIILIVTLIYIIKTSDEEESLYMEEEPKEDIDLQEVVSNLESTTPPVADFTNYEKDQEAKATISYDELLARNNQANINYNEEKILDDEISVKKVNLDQIINESENKNISLKETEDKFQEEEQFLEQLKSMSDVLNN